MFKVKFLSSVVGKFSGDDGCTYYIDVPKKGKRGKFWVNIYRERTQEDGGDMERPFLAWKTPTPGFSSRDRAIDECNRLIGSKIYWDHPDPGIDLKQA